MPIGSYTHQLTCNPVKRVLRLAFGTLDLHSHLRLRPMLDYVDTVSELRTQERLRVLELGCGCGVNLFELAERLPNLNGVGYDLNPEVIEAATKAAAHLFPERLSFQQADACRQGPPGEFDVVLLIDFLEHVPNPREILERVASYVSAGGRVLISVPTPRYPQVFGRKFHEAVGHLVEGYDLLALNALVPQGLRLIHSRYSTGLIALAPCALTYRVLRSLPKSLAASLLRLGTLLFAPFDFFNGPGRSCSLFAVYQKQ